MTPRLEIAAVTHRGQVRTHNEDSIAADAHARFAVLADGMGGHNAGEVASRIAVELASGGIVARLAETATLDAPRAERLIAEQVSAANAALLRASSGDPAYEGMGTTLVMALWHAEGVSYGHVGDSRLYRLRAGRLKQLTRDHSYVQEQLERGAISAEQARYAPNRNVLTRAVGIDPAVEAELGSAAVEPGDVYLLCSDGLTDMLTDDEIRDALSSDVPDAEGAAHRLVHLANESGGLDNISVIVARVPQAGRERP